MPWNCDMMLAGKLCGKPDVTTRLPGYRVTKFFKFFSKCYTRDTSRNFHTANEKVSSLTK